MYSSIGFENKVQLLEYFSKSKYLIYIKFKQTIKFRHDYKRLKSFQKLVYSG